MSPKEVSPGSLRFASWVAETAEFLRHRGHLVGGDGEGRSQRFHLAADELRPRRFVGRRERRGRGSTTCIVPGFGIAGRVTLVITPVPPVTGSGTKSLPTPVWLHHQVQVGAPIEVGPAALSQVSPG